MKRVVLIKAPSDFLISDMAMPNLGIMYLASAVKRAGVDVEIVHDADSLRIRDNTLYGVSATSPQYKGAVSILRYIKDQFDHRIPVVIGGPCTVGNLDLILKDGWDCAVRGEGERLLLSILDGYRGFQGAIYGMNIKDIDSLPLPERHPYDLHLYNYQINGRRSTTMVTSRGCRYNKCDFCSKVWSKVRYHSVDRIKQELDDIERCRFRAVTIFDDSFYSLLGRDAAIAREMGRRGFIWRCLARADDIIRNEEAVKIGGQNGNVEIMLGVESGSDRILKNINKGVTVDQNKEAIDIIKKAGIKVKASMIVGLPGEDEESIDETERFLQDTKPDWIAIGPLCVYPGSAIYNRPQDYDISFGDRSLPFKAKLGEDECDVSTSKLSSQRILEARDHLESSYRIVDEEHAKNLNIGDKS